jgi:hypothetical protein
MQMAADGVMFKFNGQNRMKLWLALALSPEAGDRIICCVQDVSTTSKGTVVEGLV